jgi:hypothetical protein
VKVAKANIIEGIEEFRFSSFALCLCAFVVFFSGLGALGVLGGSIFPALPRWEF